jgi:hypothetical protein
MDQYCLALIAIRNLLFEVNDANMKHRKNIHESVDFNTMGGRLRYIRFITRLTRKNAQETFGFPPNTLYKWENEKVTIRKSNLQKLLKSYEDIGITCTADWIEYGLGRPPFTNTEKLGKHISSLKSNNQKGKKSKINDMTHHEFMKDNPNFYTSYVKKDETFAWVDGKYERIFNKPTQEIIGKTLREMIGEQGYRNVKPYIEKVLQGQEVSFEYGWEFEPQQYMQLKLIFHPDRDEETGAVVGFFSFMEDKEASKSPHSKEFTSAAAAWQIPSQSLPEYDQNLYKLCLDMTVALSKKHGLDLKFDLVTSIASNLYYRFYKDGKVDHDYADSIVRISVTTLSAYRS